MTNQITTNILFFYALFLWICGIGAVLLIGIKAKTALISGGMSGLLALIITYMNYKNISVAPLLGVLWPAILFCVFSWRSAKTLFKIFELIPTRHEDLNGKGIAFLIISLIAIVSIVVMMIQLVFVYRIEFGLL